VLAVCNSATAVTGCVTAQISLIFDEQEMVYIVETFARFGERGAGNQPVAH
jgi:hypothetical protein